MSSIYYTNAPKGYDYWFVNEVDPDVGRLTSGIDTDRPVRKIDLSEASEFQRMMMQDRYLSGLYPMIPEHQWVEWLEAGFAVAGEKNSGGADAEQTPPPGDHCSYCGGTIDETGAGHALSCCYSNADDYDPDDEEDESDYSRGMDPDSWCADDSLEKGE